MLIATDCISEGQNLQDCDYLINYDIHWNPVRIIQRFGRIDRIGSRNASIQLVNYWPDISLDEYIRLKERIESRMVIADVTATGDDNPLDGKSNDLTYRKEQLRRMQEAPAFARTLTPERLLDSDEAAKIMNVHPKTFQKLARKGIVRGIHVGKLWRFRASTIEDWIQRQLAS